MRGLIALSPPNLPGLAAIAIDKTVFGFLLTVTLLTGVVCGIAPPFRGSKTDVVTGLKEAGFRSAGADAVEVRRASQIQPAADRDLCHERFFFGWFQCDFQGLPVLHEGKVPSPVVRSPG